MNKAILAVLTAIVLLTTACGSSKGGGLEVDKSQKKDLYLNGVNTIEGYNAKSPVYVSDTIMPGILPSGLKRSEMLSEGKGKDIVYYLPGASKKKKYIYQTNKKDSVIWAAGVTPKGQIKTIFLSNINNIKEENKDDMSPKAKTGIRDNGRKTFSIAGAQISAEMGKNLAGYKGCLISFNFPGERPAYLAQLDPNNTDMTIHDLNQAEVKDETGIVEINLLKGQRFTFISASGKPMDLNPETKNITLNNVRVYKSSAFPGYPYVLYVSDAPVVKSTKSATKKKVSSTSKKSKILKQYLVSLKDDLKGVVNLIGDYNGNRQVTEYKDSTMVIKKYKSPPKSLRQQQKDAQNANSSNSATTKGNSFNPDLMDLKK